MNHNQENPVTFKQAVKELGVSSFVLTALRTQLGIKGRRPFMLSPIRDFILANPGWTTKDVYGHGEKSARIQVKHDGKRWVVCVQNKPDVMAMDKQLSSALATLGGMIEQKFST
jgi:hypothetical protein